MSLFKWKFFSAARRKAEEAHVAAPGAMIGSGAGQAERWQQSHKSFFTAIAKGDTQTIQTVVNRYPDALKWTNTNKMLPPLAWAMKHDNVNSFACLLDCGADVNHVMTCPHDTSRRARINFYAMINDKPDFLYVLLQRGATMKSENSWETSEWKSSGTNLKDWMLFAIQNKHTKSPIMLDMINRADSIRREFLSCHHAPALERPEDARQAPEDAQKDPDAIPADEKKGIKQRVRALEKEVRELKERLAEMQATQKPDRHTLDKPKPGK